MSIELLTNNHLNKIISVLNNTKSEIKIISPFIKVEMTQRLCAIVKKKNIKCTVITRFYYDNLIKGISDFEAIEMMLDCGIKVYILKELHTKLYLFDDNCGILGSANFTQGGFQFNHELSLYINNDEETIYSMHQYFDTMVMEIGKQGDKGLIYKEWLIEQKSIIADGKKDYKKALKHNCLNTYNKTFGANVQMEEVKNMQDSDSVQNMFAIKNNESESAKIKYFIKPVGSADTPFVEGKIILDSKMYFSKRFPKAIDKGSIMIAYGVGVHRILGYYRSISDEAMIDPDNVSERWPHYVDSICMNKKFSEKWWEFNLYLKDIKEDFLVLYPNSPLTYVGTQSLGALNWSSDKIRLSTEFAEYIIDRINKAVK